MIYIVSTIFVISLGYVIYYYEEQLNICDKDKELAIKYNKQFINALNHTIEYEREEYSKMITNYQDVIESYKRRELIRIKNDNRYPRIIGILKQLVRRKLNENRNLRNLNKRNDRDIKDLTKQIEKLIPENKEYINTLHKIFEGLYYNQELNKLMILEDLTYIGEFDNLSSNTEGTNE